MGQSVYLNGEFIPADRPCISPFDRGFLYGDGIFETIRADNGVPEFLGDHLSRLERAAEAVSLELPETSFPGIINELLARNGLNEGCARVKIIITRGIQPSLSLHCIEPLTVLVTAVAQGPLHIPQRIGIYPERRTTPAAKHKTLCYLFNLMAKQWAADSGYDDALLLGCSGEILECTSSNIFIERGTEIIKPLNQGYFLEGIMGMHFCRDREAEGFSITERMVLPEDICSTDTVWVTNSMIRSVTVSLASG
jgi:branched-subunit amino acid aminotransferase/4-amino-4-deoxychorismate lyase